MRQTDIGRQNAMCQARECLLRRVRVNGAQAAEMARVQRLQQIESFGAADLADENAIRPVPQCRAKQIRDRHRRQRRLLSERRLRAARLQTKDVRFVEVNLRRLLDQDNPVPIGNVRRESIQKRRLPSARSARDQDVLLAGHGGHQFRCGRRRDRAHTQSGRPACIAG